MSSPSSGSYVTVGFVRRTIDWYDIAAAAPHQVLTRAELLHLGVTERMIWARVREGGPWQRLLPGVVMLRNGTPTPGQRFDAALRYAGSGAVLTGLAAATLHGLRKFPDTEQVHLLVPAERKPMTCGPVLVERTTRMPATVQRSGFPVAEVTRAVLDAVRRMTDRGDVEALLAEAVQRGWTTPRRLRRELEAGSRRGSALPRACLGAIEGGARSTAEARAYRLAARSGLPTMRWNPELRTRSGRILPSPDGWIDEACLAWEIDSYEHHLAPVDYRRTLERHNIMTAHGIVVVHTVPSRLRTEPQQVIAELCGAFEQAMKRPRPDIIASW